MKNIYFETLGCSKNQVDSEKMIHLLEENGYLIVNSPEAADCIIINTCSFIKLAKEEAIETILELLEYKIEGSCQRFIVAGCLAQRYARDLKNEIKEIDVVIGVGDISQIITAVEGDQSLIIPQYQANNLIKRKFLSFPGIAYLRISDGCSNYCSFCSIPMIRGSLRSREIYDILEEVDFIKKNNIIEINIIAQDTTNYGLDLYSKSLLGDLIHQIDQHLTSDVWLRILYMHPDHINEILLNQLAKAKHFIPYFDLPFQSGSQKILQLMGRSGNAAQYLSLINRIRNTFSQPVIRSTFIVGFPEESEKDYAETQEFVNKADLDWVGVFSYSKEENTRAARLKKQVPARIKENRQLQLYQLAEEKTSHSLKRFINTRQKILIEEKVAGEDLYIGRFWGQAPDVDGLTVIECLDTKPGHFVEAEIKKLNGKDFYAVC